jgi:hypothetical protein
MLGSHASAAAHVELVVRGGSHGQVWIYVNLMNPKFRFYHDLAKFGFKRLMMIMIIMHLYTL